MGMVVVRAAAVGFLAEHTVAARLLGWGIGRVVNAVPDPTGVWCARAFFGAHAHPP